jgi:flagellar hook-associated protein 2
MGISVSGIASGIDTDTIINQLLELERAPILNYQREIAIQEAKRAAYNDLNGRLEGVRSAARDLNNDDLFGVLSTGSTDPTVAQAEITNESKAAPGLYRLDVVQRAEAGSRAAQGFVDNNSTGVAVGPGTLELRLGDTGTTHTINVDSALTLSQLADAINSEAGDDIQAAIVNDGSDSNPYRLVLTSKKTGRDNDLQILNNDTTLDFTNNQIEAATADTSNAADYLGQVTSSGTYTGTENTQYVVEIMQDGDASGGAGAALYRFSTDGGITFDDNGGAGYTVTDAAPIALANGVEINFTDNGTLRDGDTFRIDVFSPELVEAQDAVIKVNNLTLVKDSNTVDDVFEGLSINLRDTGSVTLSVSENTGNVTETLGAFIGAYNSVVGFLRAQFSFDPDSGQAPPILNGDSAARQIQNTIKRLVTSRVPGTDGSTISSLSELGIESDKETGLLSFDTSKVDALLRDDPDSVARVLSRFGEALSDDFTFVRRSSDTKVGEYKIEVTQARTRANITGASPADVLLADELVTFDYESDATNALSVPQNFQVQLLAGDTADIQVNRLNSGFATEGVDLVAYLDQTGTINVRATEYGDDYRIGVQSDTAAAPGTSGIGNALLQQQGTDLEGMINGVEARVLDGNHLKGANGNDAEDLEVEIPDGTAGDLGFVRIVDGLGEFLPDAIDGLTRGTGILSSRLDGIGDRITELESSILKTDDRVTQVESRLRKRFTNLEVQLGQLQALGDYVSQQMAALSNQNKR